MLADTTTTAAAYAAGARDGRAWLCSTGQALLH